MTTDGNRRSYALTGQWGAAQNFTTTIFLLYTNPAVSEDINLKQVINAMKSSRQLMFYAKYGFNLMQQKLIN